MKKEKQKVLYTLTKSEREELKRAWYMKTGLLEMISMVEKAKDELFKAITKKAGKEKSHEIKVNNNTGKVTER